MNMDDNSQKAVLLSATRFNPVDLVCGVRDYLGKPFDLMNYLELAQELLFVFLEDFTTTPATKDQTARILI